jgi:flagellar biosynthesis protein FlhF
MVNVNRYVGKTAREALAAVKAELGADAIVLSNRQVEGGIEIVAIPSDQMGALNASVRSAREPAPAPRAAAPAAPAVRAVRPAPAPQAASDENNDFTVTLGQHIAKLAREQAPSLKPRNRPASEFDQRLMTKPVDEAAGTQMNIKPFKPPRVYPDGSPYLEPESEADYAPAMPERRQRPAQGLSRQTAAAAPAPRMEASAQRDPHIEVLEASNARMAEELGSIKGMLERQLAGFAWSEMSRNAPARTQMMGELLESGFSAHMAKRLTEDMGGELPSAEARKLIKNRLSRLLKLVNSDTDIIDQGGVYALVGPTGVGKTTTAAKLAARCAVRHGAEKLALITTDGYRIGAHEQLRIYGRILGVTVHAVRDAADLRQTLQELRSKHMVLIDTVGMSQRDRMVLEQSSLLTSAGCVRRLLVLNATARGDTLDDVVQAYDGPDLAGCILSKVDESASLAPVLDVAIRRELQIFYVTNGQRVPEDLHLPNRDYLIHRALREIGGNSAFKLSDEDAGLLMASERSDGQAAQRGMR